MDQHVSARPTRTQRLLALVAKYVQAKYPTAVASAPLSSSLAPTAPVTVPLPTDSAAHRDAAVAVAERAWLQTIAPQSAPAAFPRASDVTLPSAASAASLAAGASSLTTATAVSSSSPPQFSPPQFSPPPPPSAEPAPLSSAALLRDMAGSGVLDALSAMHTECVADIAPTLVAACEHRVDALMQALFPGITPPPPTTTCPVSAALGPAAAPLPADVAAYLSAHVATASATAAAAAAAVISGDAAVAGWDGDWARLLPPVRLALAHYDTPAVLPPPLTLSAATAIALALGPLEPKRSRALGQGRKRTVPDRDHDRDRGRDRDRDRGRDRGRSRRSGRSRSSDRSRSRDRRSRDQSHSLSPHHRSLNDSRPLSRS